jgi:hypothetical protein
MQQTTEQQTDFYERIKADYSEALTIVQELKEEKNERQQ